MGFKFSIPLSIFFFIASFFSVYETYSTIEMRSLISGFFLMLITLPVLYGLYRSLGIWRSFSLFVCLGTAAFLFETSSILYGIPYGYFTYSEELGWKFFSLVPWSIFFAWTPLVLATYTISSLITRDPLKKILYAVSLLVLFDLAFDPGAVAMNLWTFEQGGFYYNVPLTNFLGWIISGIFGTMATHFFLQENSFIPHAKFLILPFISILSYWTGVVFWHGFIIPSLCGMFLLGGIFYLSKKHWKTISLLN